MHLVTLNRAGRPAPGILIGGEILDLALCGDAVPMARLVPGSVRGILAGDKPAIELLRRIHGTVASETGLATRLRAAGALIAREGAALLAPIPGPGLILSCGMNYYAHLKEMNTPVPEAPAAFTKNNASIIGTGAPILLPRTAPNMVDWEGEFTVVIGRPCFNVSAAEALDYVAGYTIVNDVSARDWVAPIFAAKGIMGPIEAWGQNLLGKQFPTFCPMGPAIVTADEIADPDDLQLTTTLNGEVMQSTSTSDLVFNVVRLIEFFSRYYRFLPGDLITTGSPSGVGFGRTPKLFMKPGDTVTVTVEGIGALVNPVALA